jgi:hypothetical protein
LGTFTHEEISRDEMIHLMSGADELQNLEEELREFSGDALARELAEALREEEEAIS